MKIKVAASQFQTIKGDINKNINKAINLADQAVAEGVNIFLLQSNSQQQPCSNMLLFEHSQNTIFCFQPV